MIGALQSTNTNLYCQNYLFHDEGKSCFPKSNLLIHFGMQELFFKTNFEGLSIFIEKAVPKLFQINISVHAHNIRVDISILHNF